MFSSQRGGLTPSAGLIALCRQTLAVTKLHVLLRPRAGDFLYDGDELRVMGADLVQAQNLGADGVVLGCLRADGTLDLAQIAALLSDVEPHTAVTLHRAFDMVKDQEQALLQVLEFNARRRSDQAKISRILTSGGEASAWAGKEQLKYLQDCLNHHASSQLTLLAGAGINAQNIVGLVQHTGVREFHFSGSGVVPSRMLYRHPRVHMGIAGADEYSVGITDPEKVQDTIAALRSLETGKGQGRS